MERTAARRVFRNSQLRVILHTIKSSRAISLVSMDYISNVSEAFSASIIKDGCSWLGAANRLVGGRTEIRLGAVRSTRTMKCAELI